MVKKWIKELNIINLNTNIDFDKIIFDILNWNYHIYDVTKMSWYNNLYRIRIWTYRIIFKDIKWKINIESIKKRWNIYKWL